MAHSRTILIIGTADTKSNEMAFLQKCVASQHCRSIFMDISVLGNSDLSIDYSKHDVCAAANESIENLCAQGDENFAMQKMAMGATVLTVQLYRQKAFDALIILGGSMGTDLALDVTNALPFGVPKIVISTIAFSHLIPPYRLSSDLTMILWAGGLYGLNSICQASLSQAAGAACGAARAIYRPEKSTPKVAISSFGKSVAKWMVRLVPELEQRGYEATVFHATGMGGRAIESLAAQGEFVAVMDFALQEVTNHYFGSVVSSGAQRLTHAGKAGIPQIIAPGFIDLVDMPSWQKFPSALQGRDSHTHNRLITSVGITPNERVAVMKIIADKLKTATAPVAFILPNKGIHEWDRVGQPMRDEEGIEAANQIARQLMPQVADFYDLDAHINDAAFCDQALKIFDDWIAHNIICQVSGS